MYKAMGSMINVGFIKVAATCNEIFNVIKREQNPNERCFHVGPKEEL
jgi:hypothetical protein